MVELCLHVNLPIIGDISGAYGGLGLDKAIWKIKTQS